MLLAWARWYEPVWPHPPKDATFNLFSIISESALKVLVLGWAPSPVDQGVTHRHITTLRLARRCRHCYRLG